MGWEVTSGFHIATDGAVPETGTVDIVMVARLGGQTYRYPVEPFPAERLAAWRGYSLDMHGQPALDPQHPREPAWRVFEDDGTPRHPIELVRIRVQAAGSDLFAELIVLPIEGVRPRPGIFGWETGPTPRIPPPAEIEKAVRGLELLGLVRELEAARHAGGMPSFYDDANEHIFFERLESAVHDIVRDGGRVSLASLKSSMGLDRRTVGKYVKDFGYDLTALEAEAARCTHNLSPCTVHVRRRAEFKKKRV